MGKSIEFHLWQAGSGRQHGGQVLVTRPYPPPIHSCMNINVEGVMTCVNVYPRVQPFPQSTNPNLVLSLYSTSSSTKDRKEGRTKARKEDRRQKGRQEGRQEGRQKGRQEGRQEGRPSPQGMSFLS